MLVTLGDSICADAGSWVEQMPGPVLNLAMVGAQIPDLLEQLREAPEAPAAVISIGTNHVVKPGGPLDFDLRPVAVQARSRFERVAVLPVLSRESRGGPWAAEFDERRRLFLAALDAADLAPLTFRLRPWDWRRDDMHLTRLGNRRVAREVRAWLAQSPSRLSHR